MPMVTVAVACVDVDDVAPLARRDPEAAALTDREHRDTVVLADRGAVVSTTGPGRSSVRAGEERLAPTARDEAHVHALGLGRGAQPEARRVVAHLGLGEVTDRAAACARARAAPSM